MLQIIQKANTSPEIKKVEVIQGGMAISHLVILNAVHDIEDIQGKE